MRYGRPGRAAASPRPRSAVFWMRCRQRCKHPPPGLHGRWTKAASLVKALGGVVVGVGQQGDAQTALLLGVRQRGVQQQAAQAGIAPSRVDHHVFQPGDWPAQRGADGVQQRHHAAHPAIGLRQQNLAQLAGKQQLQPSGVFGRVGLKVGFLGKQHAEQGAQRRDVSRGGQAQAGAHARWPAAYWLMAFTTERAPSMIWSMVWPASRVRLTLCVACSRISLMFCTATWVCVWMSDTILLISAVEAAVRSASLRTSSATTAKPRPVSPARAASMAAFSAKRLVWAASSPSTLAMLPMSCERWRSARICADEPCTAWAMRPISSAAVRTAWRPFSESSAVWPELCS